MQKDKHMRRCAWLALMTVVGFGATSVVAQETLHLYGPLGLNPAIEEAAVVFAARNDLELEVATGSMDDWREKAKEDGDLIFCSGEFIMSDFARDGGVPLDEASVTPLYLRRSTMLVRPGNPKDIRDFPDLLRPGIRVMIVNGSGQTGLWEDMTGRLQSLQNLVALQKNIVFCAPDTTHALQTWRERPDIDAWLTWNVWHMPRRDDALLVPISDDYLIYRRSSISLTERGKHSPLAAAFMDFLVSDEGTAIFNSWGWTEAPPGVSPAIAERGVCVACRIRKDVWTNSVGRGLDRVRRLVQEYQSLGIPEEDIHICAVFDDEASYWMLNDDTYRRFAATNSGNPNRSVVEELVKAGVSVEITKEWMGAYGWTADDILPGVKVVTGASERIAELGVKGYSYLPF